MEQTPLFLDPAQARYLERLLPPADAIEAEMERLAGDTGLSFPGRHVGSVLRLLARSRGAGSFLEIGTGTGYGALQLALGAPEARIATLDEEREGQSRIRELLDRAGVGDRVHLVRATVDEFLARYEGRLDLVLLAGRPQRYRRALDLLLPCLEVGGLLLVTDLLWGGRVAEPGEEEDEVAESLYAFNGYFMMHPQLASALLPVGNGLGLGVKTKPLVTELGGPF